MRKQGLVYGVVFRLSRLIASRVKRKSAGDTEVTQRIVQYNAVVQAALAINRLGPCAAALTAC